MGELLYLHTTSAVAIGQERSLPGTQQYPLEAEHIYELHTRDLCTVFHSFRRHWVRLLFSY